MSNAPEYPPIIIVHYSEVVDNWGRREECSDPDKIKSILENAEEFNDDMTFEADNGQLFFIDELIGHRVQVGASVFVVPSD